MSEVTYNEQKRDYKEQFRKKAENARRRKETMDTKVFQLKIQYNKLNETQKKFLLDLFFRSQMVVQ